jgi:hypothetical protein
MIYKVRLFLPVARQRTKRKLQTEFEVALFRAQIAIHEAKQARSNP